MTGEGAPRRALQVPRAILFDWDNTLIDSWQVIEAALSETFEAFGRRPWTAEEVRANVRASARESFPKLFGPDAEEATRVFYDAFGRLHLDALAPLPHAEEVLADLVRAEIVLGVVSNKTGDFLRREAEHLGWSHFFHRIVGATDAARDKPASDPVLMALDGTSISPGADVWFVGDTDIDMECAAVAGCTAVLVRAEPPGAEEFGVVPPAVHVSDLSALRSLLPPEKWSEGHIS